MATANIADRAATLEAVRAEARGCQRCPLWEIGTQTVFGAGPAEARLLFLGEAPGATEDAEGIPFVGSAGRLFDDALERAGLERDRVYVTNTVKHRPWVKMGPRQKNRAPKQSEINACRVWLDRELEIVRPAIVACLGAVAAKAMLGRDFKLTQQRGEWQQASDGAAVLATVHPSFVLIQPADSRDRWREAFFADIAAVAERHRSLR